jgi:iron complex outermembrane recepter protein
MLATLLIGCACASAAWAQAATDAPPPAAEPPAPEPAAAAEPSSPIQEIVITATRRSELQSRVPISVSAFSQETLDRRGAKDFTDIVRFTPGVTLDANGTNNISIRGISSSAGSGTTGIYIDDTPIQTRALSFYTDDALPKAFDLERVEVLRGPQGTLFGAGAEGGAVRYIMAQPNLHNTSMNMRGELAFTQSGSASYEAGVAYGTPIVDGQLGIRGSVWYRHDGGWIDHVDPFTLQTTDTNTNYSDDVMIRLAAKWAVGEVVKITPSFVYQNRRVNDVTAYWPVASKPGSDIYRLGDPERLGEPDRYYLPALKIEAEFETVSLFSNTSFFSRHDLAGYSGTNYNLGYYQTFNSPGVNCPTPPVASAACTPNPGYLPFADPTLYPLVDGSGLHLPASLRNYRAPGIVTNDQKTFTQEFRLQSSDPAARFNWLAGLFYSVSRQTSTEEIDDPSLPVLFQTLFATDYTTYFGLPLLPNGDSFYDYNFSRDRQMAVFGELSYAVTDKLKLTAGLRYSKTDTNFDNFVDGPQNFGQTGGSGEQHEKPLTPKFSIGYQADRNNLFYATYAKGFRIGGANAPIQPGVCDADFANLGIPGEPPSYRQDTVNSYELGAKNKLGDTLRIASSLYYIRWQGIQQAVYLPTCGYQFTTNSGDAVAKGGDVQVEFAPTSWLSFDLAVGYTDATFSGDVPSGPSGISLLAAKGDAIQGASFTPAPPWTVALGVQYDFVAMDRKSYVRLDWEYASSNRTPTASEDPRTSIYDPLFYTPTATNFVSLRAGTTVDKWNLSAFIDNLLDSHPEFPPSNDPHTAVDPYNSNAPSALIRSYSWRPRTLGFTVSYKL